MDELRQKRKKKKKKIKRIILIIIILIAILTGIFFLVNKLVPVKNINDDNISINLSTIKPTGRNISATISTKTKYDIFYYIDYSAGEEQYYEDESLLEDTSISDTDEDLSNSNTDNMTNTNNSIPTNNSIENTSSKTDESEKELDIKEISNNKYKKLKNSKLEIENNGIVYLKYGRFGKLSSIPYVFEISNIDKDGPEIGDIQTSTTATSITVVANAFDKNQSNLQYYFRLASSNTYISAGTKNTYTFKDLTTDESYIIYIKVADKFGNESEAVTEATATIQDEQEEVAVKKIYHFRVNLGANTVTVYEKDDNGKFTKPIKAFVCSTGKSTPKSGTYKISVRYRWRSLFGNVYGQYAVRIHGNILFHSVPYKQMYPNTLEYEEYDKLGTSASMGCIRLCVRDAKWIYDNAKAGSTVEFYSNSSEPGPLGKPKSQKISNNRANRNWDPTDPDKHNPWNGGDGAVTKTKIINDDDTDYIKQKDVTDTTTDITTNTSTNTLTSSNTTISNQTVDNSVQIPEESTNTTTNDSDYIIPIENTTTTPNVPTEDTVENTTVTPPVETPDEPVAPEEPPKENTSDTPPQESDDVPIIPDENSF